MIFNMKNRNSLSAAAEIGCIAVIVTQAQLWHDLIPQLDKPK